MKRGYSSSVISVIILAIVGVLWWQRQAIYDWWQLRDYVPSAQVEKLATDSSMTNEGRRLFYVNHPTLLQDKVIFRQHCSISEQTIVLGCYIEGQGIYLYDVTDERLAGIEEVTAAHETLHVVYDRMSNGERQRINSLLIEVFNNLEDERIKSVIEQYRKRDPSVVPNELHSILGTEVSALNPELEQHYSLYIFDRSKIVGLSRQYEQVFTTRKNQITSYDKQLSGLKTQIETLEQQLINEQANLDSERRRLDSLLNDGQVSEYNSGVSSFNARVQRYNASVARSKRLVAEYNEIVSKRNAIALEQQELVKAIDSRVDSQATH